MKSIRILPAAVALFGIVGAILRGRNLYTGYEPVTNLPIAGNMPQTALILLSVVFFFAMLLWSTVLRSQKGTAFEDAFGCEHTIYKMTAVLAALIMGVCGAGGLYLLFAGGSYPTVGLTANLPLIPLWILAIVTAYSFVTVASSQAHGYISENRAAFTVVPMFWACFDLIITFKDNGASPFVSLYAFELFAAVFLVYAFYCMAAFLYSTGNPVRFVCTASLAVFFCMICIGGYLVCAALGGSTVVLDTEGMLRYGCFGGSALYLLANLRIVTMRLSSASQHGGEHL